MTAISKTKKLREKRIKKLIGKLPSELNGNQLRTLKMAIDKKFVKIDKFSGVISLIDNFINSKLEK